LVTMALQLSRGRAGEKRGVEKVKRKGSRLWGREKRSQNLKKKEWLLISEAPLERGVFKIDEKGGLRKMK